MKKLFQLIFFYIVISFCNFQYVFADNFSTKLNNIFGKITEESNSILNKTLDSFSSIMNELDQAIDEEIASLKSAEEEESKIDIQDKMDSIRIHLEDITDLKKKESSASNFTIISKSKKDYRIKIDEVLEEIEPILFDGEVVNYASRIREIRKNIKDFETQKVRLNEKFVFAPEKESLLKSSKKEIKNEIKKIDRLIKKSYKLIDELEFDLKRKMHKLGIKLTREQIRVMTTRIDGDELSRSFAIFDVTKQISETLSKIMTENSFSGTATVKYYGTYVVMSEILGFSQRRYIEKIEDTYLPALDKIEKNIKDAIEFAETSIKGAKTEQSKKILKSNIKSNEFTMKVLGQYRNILINQMKSLQNALDRTKEQITVAYSTYDTAANSANLVNLINQTQDSFNKIMNMQLPNIVPFENKELEIKFLEISDQLVQSTES
tara:strand:+ start:26 stop:1330 length:1305 start_codon:yes stop_codon:yes gene_type:complete